MFGRLSSLPQRTLTQSALRAFVADAFARHVHNTTDQALRDVLAAMRSLRPADLGDNGCATRVDSVSGTVEATIKDATGL